MKTVKQNMVALTVAVLLGALGTTAANAGISIGFGGGGILIGFGGRGMSVEFGPGAAGSVQIPKVSDSNTGASVFESETVSVDEDIPCRPPQPNPRSASVENRTSQDKCDPEKNLAEIDSLMSRLKEVQGDVKAGYQDTRAIAEFARVVVKKLNDLEKCAVSDQTTKSAIAERYHVVEKILSESISYGISKPKAGG